MSKQINPPRPRGRFRGAKVAVLMGGLSSERAVSLASGAAVTAALIRLGYDVESIDAGHDLPAKLVQAGAQVVFIALHGTYGEDGRVQGLLDWMNLPYTGEGLRASLLAMDKGLAKQAFKLGQLPLAEDRLLCPAQARSLANGEEAFGLPLPVVVKPACEGSSVGVTLVKSSDALGEALLAAARSGAVLIERFVPGVELSIVSLGDEVLGSVEIEPARSFYDYAAKYQATGTRYHLPPRLPALVQAQAEAAGLAAHRALGCRGLTRTDVIVGPDGPIVLEVNTLPGMTETSLVPKVAASLGLSFDELVELILDRAQCGLEAD